MIRPNKPNEINQSTPTQQLLVEIPPHRLRQPGFQIGDLLFTIFLSLRPSEPIQNAVQVRVDADAFDFAPARVHGQIADLNAGTWTRRGKAEEKG